MENKKSEMIVEVKTMKAPSYKVLERENLRLEVLNGQLQKKIAGMQKTMDKLRARIGLMEKNMQKTIKSWNKDRGKTEKDKAEDREKYPWMAVGC